MLYLVGLGLSDETDITVRGLEVVKKASRVYLEAYTSILLVDQAVLVSCLPTNLPGDGISHCYSAFYVFAYSRLTLMAQ